MSLLLSEWTKLRSLRSTYWIFVIMAVLAIGASIGMGIGLHHDLTNDSFDTTEANAIGLMLLTGLVYGGQILVSVLGAGVITNEFRTGLIRTTLTAVRNRFAFVIAKLLVFSVAVYVVAVLLALLAMPLIGKQITFSGIHGGSFDSGFMWRCVLLGALYVLLVGVMAFGFGLLWRHSSAAIVTVLGLIFVVPIVGQIIHNGTKFSKFSPLLLAQQSLVVEHLPNTDLTLSPGAAILVMLIWALVPLTLGLVVFMNRDA
jgi:ABC-2 type transport system permease protein